MVMYIPRAGEAVEQFKILSQNQKSIYFHRVNKVDHKIIANYIINQEDRFKGIYIFKLI